MCCCSASSGMPPLGGSPIVRRSTRSCRWRTSAPRYQAVAVLLIGSIARPRDRNSEFFWSFGIGLMLTCAIFTFAPALGKVGHLGDYIATLTTIRSGMWAVLDYSRAEGIITFPSFHATLAILFVYAVRRHRWALAVFVPLNALLIAATPTVGGHYLVDLPAGVIVAVASIAITRALRRRLFSSQVRVRPLAFSRPS